MHRSWRTIHLDTSVFGKIGFGIEAIACPNIECKKLKLSARLTKSSEYGIEMSKVFGNWDLMPESEARVLPDYVPYAVKEDYYEACRIKSLSPKASATLSRRCLQGMIRDFHNIVKSSLFEEVKELEGKVDSDVWESIDAVRKVGNIGAHMEKNINEIVEVEPEEAQLLIELIEQLIDEWYVARQDRKNRAEKLKTAAAKKTQL